MNQPTPAARRNFLTFLLLAALPGVVLAQPNLTTFTFSPTSINTAAGPADVTVTFDLADTAANISYFEMAFIDPTGAFVQRGFKSMTPAPTVSDSVIVNFPRFSNAGTWKVLAVFAADTMGNTLFLDTAGVIARGFPTNLVVSSAVDNTPPNVTSFSFSPSTINTTAAAQNVTVTFTATDDLAGVASVYAGFVSPSGQISRGTRVNAPVDFTAGLSVTSSLMINLPKGSEGGTWKVSFINIVDSAGNTLFLDTAAAAARFPAAQNLSVTTTADTTAPNLTALTLSTSTMSSAGGSVNADFSVTDDLSGANDFEILLMSPSGLQTQSTAVGFVPNTSFSGTAVVNFPAGAEVGVWTIPSIFLSDAAGNTRTVGSALTLTVTAPGADTTPPVIDAVVNPAANGAGWNNTTPVTVTWSVTDPESNITSQTGCSSTTVTAPTTGTLLTCSATNGAGLSSSNSVTIKVDTTPPVTSNVLTSPDPVPPGSSLTISATVTDAGGSNVAGAEYNVDGGAFDDLMAVDGTFDSSTENVSVTLPINHPLLAAGGTHTVCVRGIDGADNIGAQQCKSVTIQAHAPTIFIGLKNSDDQGTNFDVQVDILKNGNVVASGLTRCIVGVTRNQNLAKEVSIPANYVTDPFDPFSTVSLATGDVLSMRVLTRIGTNPDGTQCGGHSNAVGLRVYYDSTTNPSRLIAAINAGGLTNFFLDTTGASDFLTTTAPTGTTEQFKDSASVNFNGGNLFKEVATWSMIQP